MKKSTPTLTPSRGPSADVESELARRRAAHRIRDAARILTDAMPYIPRENRSRYTELIDQLTTIERHLHDLANQSHAMKQCSRAEPDASPLLDRVPVFQTPGR